MFRGAKRPLKITFSVRPIRFDRKLAIGSFKLKNRVLTLLFPADTYPKIEQYVFGGSRGSGITDQRRINVFVPTSTSTTTTTTSTRAPSTRQGRALAGPPDKDKARMNLDRLEDGVRKAGNTVVTKVKIGKLKKAEIHYFSTSSICYGECSIIKKYLNLNSLSLL